MKIILVVNPTASSVDPHSQVLVSKKLAEQHEVEILLTDGRGHAVELAQKASKGDADALIVYGGDGTLNEVANGLIGSDLSLGILPGGSTNVLSRIIGLDDDPIVATEQVLNGLKHRNFSKVGVGEVNDRIFLFHAGIGFDAKVIQRVEGRSDLKRWMSHLLFIYSGFMTWLWKYDKKESHFKLEFEDGDIVDGFFSVCLNANPYTYLGSRPLNLVPQQKSFKLAQTFHFRGRGQSSFNEKLALATATSLKANELLRFVRKALSKKQSLKGDPAIDFRFGQEGFMVHSEREFPFQVDGDFLGYTTELQFRHRPDSLSLLLPPKL